MKSEGVIDGASSDDYELACVKWIECKLRRMTRTRLTK